MDNATYYFTKSTNKELYKYVNILEYIDGEYVLTNKISDQNIKEMRSNMDQADVEAFDRFVEENWGSGAKKPVWVGAQEPAKKRGRKPKITKE